MRRLVSGLFMLLALLAGLAALLFDQRSREESAALDRLIREAVAGTAPADTEAVAIAIAREVFRRTNRRVAARSLTPDERLVSRSPLNVPSGVSLRYGMYALEDQPHAGPCGTMTRVTTCALRRLGIPARKLHLLDDPSPEETGHVMVEFRSRGRWFVLSPGDSAFVWRRPDGAIATLAEIRADSTIFAEIFAREPAFAYRFTRTRNIRWEKLPAPARALFRAALGARGYEAATTPALYDQPMQLLRLASLAAAFALAALLARRPARPRMSPR